MVTDTANSFITYYAAAAEAVRGLQKRKQARDDQFHEDVDREDELLEEKWRAIDSRDDLTASEKITFKENAQAERDQRVAGLTLNLEEENEKDQRNTEEDIETLNKTSFLGDLKGLVLPAAALLVGGLVITKL